MIHSFPFIFLLTLRKAVTLKGRISQWYFFGFLISLYVFAASQEGMLGLTAFLSSVFATYLGFILHVGQENAMIQSFSRWIISFVFFVVFSGISKLPESVQSWHLYDETFKFGFLFFTALGVVEFSGLYAKLQQKIRKKEVLKAK